MKPFAGRIEIWCQEDNWLLMFLTVGCTQQELQRRQVLNNRVPRHHPLGLPRREAAGGSVCTVLCQHGEQAEGLLNFW